MDIGAYFRKELAEHREVAGRVEQGLSEPFARLVAVCAKALRGGNKLTFIGNGGSAADAQISPRN